MKLFLYLTDMIVPFMIFAILAYGVQKKVRVYDTFIEGAREGLLTVVKIVPTLIGLMTAVGILRAFCWMCIKSTERIPFWGLPRPSACAVRKRSFIP